MHFQEEVKKWRELKFQKKFFFHVNKKCMRDKIFLMIILADNSIINLVVDRVQQNPIFR